MEAQAGDDGIPLRLIVGEERRGFLAHKHVLYWLLRRGYPFRTTFFEIPDPEKLLRARVVLIPFPAALTKAECRLVADLAKQGKTVILFDLLSPLDELGRRLDTPRLAGLFSGRPPAAATPGPVTARLGNGKIIFLGANFPGRLFATVKPVRDRSKRVPLAAFNPETSAVLEQLIGTRYSLFARQPTIDVEVTRADGPQGKVLLVINWDPDKATDIALRPEAIGNATRARGFTITADAKVAPIDTNPRTLHLAPQQAILAILK